MENPHGIAPINPKIFQLLRQDPSCIEKLVKFQSSDLRPFFPTLLRLSLCPESVPGSFDENMRELLRLEFLECGEVNSLIQLMGADFLEIDSDVRKEIAIKKKTLNIQGTLPKDTTVASAMRFEVGDASEKHRILLGQLLTTELLIEEDKLHPLIDYIEFEPLDNVLLFESACDSLCVCLAEIPNLDLNLLSRALLFYENGPKAIQRIVANAPQAWLNVLKFLIEQSGVTEGNNLMTRQLEETIALLLNLLPNRWMEILSLMVSTRKYPGLTIGFGADYLSPTEFIDFLSDLVFDQSVESISAENTVSEWILHFIQICQKNPNLNSDCVGKMKQKICERIRFLLGSCDENRVLPEEKILESVQLLRTVTAVKAMAALRLSGEELSEILGLVTLRVPLTRLGAERLVVAFASVVACPTFIAAPGGGASPEAEQVFIDWIRWMLAQETNFDRECGFSCYGETLLLAAMHFHTGQFTMLSQLIDPILGFEVPLQHKMMQRLKTIFTLDLFPEQTLASRAADVAVTRGLSAQINTYLPVHCVLQLMRTRAFSKHKVPIKDWIVSQVQECVTPIHPVMTELLETYVRSCITPLTKHTSSLLDKSHGSQSGTGVNPQLDECFLLEVFKNDPLDENRVVARVLFLYYLMFFEDTRISEVRKIVQAGKWLDGYSGSLWDLIPVKFLLDEVERNERDFLPLYTSLMKLAATFYPHMLKGVRHSNIRSNREREKAQIILTGLTEQQFKERFLVSGEEAMNLLKCLGSVSPRQRLKFMDAVIEVGFGEFLREETPALYILEFADLWTSLESVLPMKVYEKTVSVLQACKGRSPTHKDLCDDPLEILRVDERIYRSPKLLELLLRMMKFYLTASKIRLELELSLSPLPNSQSNEPGENSQQQAVETVLAERERLVSALISAQESAVVQVLLEACLSSPAEKDSRGLTILSEIRSIVCCFIHEMFIGDRGNVLIKLVHFQGYQKELMKVTVKGVPSMHVCLDFIPELISQPGLNKRVFAVDLLAELSEQYTIPKALSCAKLVVDAFSTFISVLPMDVTLQLFVQLIPAFCKLSQLFPPLKADIHSIFRQLRQICMSRAAVFGRINLDEWTLMNGNGESLNGVSLEKRIKKNEKGNGSVEMEILKLLNFAPFI